MKKTKHFSAICGMSLVCLIGFFQLMQLGHAVAAPAMLTAVDDSYSSVPNTPLEVAMPGLLANDVISNPNVTIIIDNISISGTVALTSTNWYVADIHDEMAADRIGRYTSPINVNGHPALAYITNDNTLIYRRALDVKGSSWGPTVIIDSAVNLDQATSLGLVNGLPAIAYASADATGQTSIRYVQANDVNGDTWKSPIIISAHSDCVNCVIEHKMLNLSFSVIGGKPAIAYYNAFTLGTAQYEQALFVQALDINGQTWGTPTGLGDAAPTITQASISLAEVNGKVAASYALDGRVYYVQLMFNPFTGASSGTPIFLGYGKHNSLATVGNKPSVTYDSYDGIRYVRALDIDGAAWTTPVLVVSQGKFPSLELFDGTLTIRYFDIEPKYVQLSDADGSNWEAADEFNLPFFSTDSASIAR